MNKKQVQKRVLQNGKPLGLDRFSWDEKTMTFSSDEDGLVLDFRNVDSVTFSVGSYCTFTTDWGCTFKTGSYCTFTTNAECTFVTGWGCTFITSWGCTFKTYWGCTFKTGTECTFKTGTECTFVTGSSCTFTTDWECVIIRKDPFQANQVIQPKKGEIIKLCPNGVRGYISKQQGEQDFHMEIDGERVPHVIVDGILSKVINKKGNVYRVINHGEIEQTYIVTDGVNFAHGKTLKEARESLIYKISNRDTSEYENLTLESEISLENAIRMYRKITGSCESQVKAFVKNMENKKETYKISELIEITEGQFGNKKFAGFFDNRACHSGRIKPARVLRTLKTKFGFLLKIIYLYRTFFKTLNFI